MRIVILEYKEVKLFAPNISWTLLNETDRSSVMATASCPGSESSDDEDDLPLIREVVKKIEGREGTEDE